MLLLSIGIALHGIHRVDPDKLDNLISLNLPMGTDKAMVIAFLDTHHIVHTDYIPEHMMIQAGIDRSSVGLVHARIHIDFLFDEKGKLVRHKLVELFEFL